MSPTITRLNRKPTATHSTSHTTASKPANQSIFDQLPDSAWLRESQLVRKASDPDSTAPLPFSAPTLWRMVKAGTFPAPAKLSTRVTAWRVSDVRAYLNGVTV